MRGSKIFQNRREAGRVLAQQLQHHRGRDDVVVLALPRGGVPVGYEVAAALSAPLDVFVVRKLAPPDQPEYAVGAIASGGVVVTNDDAIRALHVTSEDLEAVAEREQKELRRREEAYRNGRRPPEIAGKTVIVVDDGLATGATMTAALRAIDKLGPAQVVVAVPAAPEDTCEELRHRVDEVVCATTPQPFTAVGQSYWDFEQTTDDEVRQLLSAPTVARRAADEPGDAAAAVRRGAVPAPAGIVDDDELFDLVGDARLVLIGEASHGTHEFYAARAHMTRRLIEEKGFQAVAVEGDWPDAYRINRYVRTVSEDRTPAEALDAFRRFPQWMWRNTVVEEFVEWLRTTNADRSPQVGFYGLDLYSMLRSVNEVISYLDARDPAAADRARERYRCFDHFRDEQRYGYAVAFGAGQSCEDEVVQQLVDLQRLDLDMVKRDGMVEDDERFYANQNARLVKAAEEYYRAMFAGHIASWNRRDRHMLETVQALLEHLDAHSEMPARCVIWAHNSHLGDARATELSAGGELNLGQLLREHYPGQCCSIGFTTYTGTVTASHAWGREPTRMRVTPALSTSVEALFHRTGLGDFMIRSHGDDAGLPASPLLERAIGVIYSPRTERQSHYFLARVADQFDAVIHVDHTSALQPLPALAAVGAPAETYPSGV